MKYDVYENFSSNKEMFDLSNYSTLTSQNTMYLSQNTM